MPQSTTWAAHSMQRNAVTQTDVMKPNEFRLVGEWVIGEDAAKMPSNAQDPSWRRWVRSDAQ
ncbi:MAG: hypothetical protein KAS32_15140 [Candidatus Peribacteraceae bacterium]|nr:hypothetical protein [Candidatus Peribacteraceae bacterium]